MELCHRILDSEGMPEDWTTSATTPIFTGKEDIMNCGMNRGVKLLQHAMKIVERVDDKRLRNGVMIDDMQFGIMPGKDTILILRRIQEEYLANQ